MANWGQLKRAQYGVPNETESHNFACSLSSWELLYINGSSYLGHVIHSYMGHVIHSYMGHVIHSYIYGTCDPQLHVDM